VLNLESDTLILSSEGTITMLKLQLTKHLGHSHVNHMSRGRVAQEDEGAVGLGFSVPCMTTLVGQSH